MPNEALADRRRPGTPPDLIRDLILGTTALALLAAWSVHESLTPGARTDRSALRLSCAYFWPSNRGCPDRSGIGWPPSPIGRFGDAGRSLSALRAGVNHVRVCDQLASAGGGEGDGPEERDVETVRRAPCEAVELASKQVSDASRKGKEAGEALNKTAVQVKLPDGKIEHRFDPEAFRLWKEAWDELVGAIKRHSAETARLLRLQHEG